jgi:SNF2 family DNA or RNA helicase
LLIANPGACAESISLHRVCKHAVYLERTFNGAQYMQSLDRIHRLGLGPGDHVHYHLLHAQGTVDEVIDKRLEEKKQRLESLLEDDLVRVDLDETGEMSEPDEEAKDFESLIAHLRAKHAGPSP